MADFLTNFVSFMIDTALWLGFDADTALWLGFQHCNHGNLQWLAADPSQYFAWFSACLPITRGTKIAL